MKDFATLEEKQNYYVQCIEKMHGIPYLEDKVKYANKLAKAFTYSPAGFFYSKDLEQVYIEYANSKSVIKDDIVPKSKSYLHVMTKAFMTGGHTRVVEKWISQASPDETHSVVLIDQGKNKIPPLLINKSESTLGQVFCLKSKSLCDKALELRVIAMQYETIVLHTHMEDPTAIVAFGNKEFKRPVIFYNHADHMFWLGRSIADKFADLRPNYKITVNKRNIHDAFFLGVPMDATVNHKSDKLAAKAKIGIPSDKKVILCVGSNFKLCKFKDKFFGNLLSELVKDKEDCLVVVLGIKNIDDNWLNVINNSNNKVILRPPVQYDNGYFDYINAADIIIDSWPMSGGTVMIDALSCDVPVLSLDNPIGQFDYLENSASFCRTKSELFDKCSLLLSDSKECIKYLNEVQNNLSKESYMDSWSEKLKKLIGTVTKEHKVQVDLNEQIDSKIDDFTELLNMIYKSNVKLFLNLLFLKIYRQKLFYANRYIIKICGITIGQRLSFLI